MTKIHNQRKKFTLFTEVINNILIVFECIPFMETLEDGYQDYSDNSMM